MVKEIKERFSYNSILEFKENEEDLIVKGYIATTHFDGQDKVTKGALDKWCKEINDAIPRVNKVGVHHNRERQPTGKGIPGSAHVDSFGGGEYGLFAETIIDKTVENYDNIVYRLDKEFLDSFSIEFEAPANPVFVDNIRVLDSNTNLYGWTLASRPMNENAVMVKELLKSFKEENTMVKKENKEETPIAEPAVKVENKPVEKVVEETKVETPVEKPVEEKVEEKVEDKELINNFVNKVMEKVDKMEVKEKVLQPKAEKIETKEVSLEVKEFLEIFDGKKEISIKEQFLRAGRLTSNDMLDKGTSKAERREFKSFGTNGNKLEYKSLGITTNQNTDTDYLQSSAELQDVYDPIIYNALQEKTVFWNILAKDDYSSKGNNQVQFALKITANTTAAFYTGNAVTTGNTGRLKYQTKFKKLQVGVSVDGDMIAAARGGPIGDVFALEVLDSTETMLSILNIALFAEVGLEAAAAPIGLEYLTDSAGNTTLYNLTRSAANKLSPDSAGDTYINQSSTVVSMKNLRLAIKQAVLEGAMRSNLVFVTNPTQVVMYKGKFDDARRYANSSNTDFGFKADVLVDDIPVFEDKDCNTDDWWLVDLETHRAAIWVPPTIEKLGKSGDSEDAFIKMYFAIYNRAPRRLVQIYGCATS